MLRGPGYRRLVKDLNELLSSEAKESPAALQRSHLENPTYEQSQWSAALQMRAQLDQLFKDLDREFPLDPATTDQQSRLAFIRRHR